MKIVFIIILTISTIKVGAQNHLIGVKGGINSTNVTSSNFISPTESKTGSTVGLSYDFLIKKHFSIGADLIYNQRGFIYNIIFTDNYGNPIAKNYTAKFNYDYVSLPIKTGFNFGTKLYGFANIGAIPSLLVDAKSMAPAFDKDGMFAGNEIFDVTKRVSKFDFAGLVEIGAGYKLNGRNWLFTSISYQHSLTTISNSDYFSDGKIRHNGMNITIGLKCALTKV